MKIEIKNIKVNLAFSEETTMFHADVFVNGKKTAYASNDGHGGSTFYNRYPNMENLLNEAEIYAKTLPSKFYGDLEIKSDLEGFIDFAIDDYINNRESEKFNKKLEKDMLTNIVYGIPDGKSYKMVGWGKLTIAQLLASPNGRLAVTKAIDRITGELKDGEKILNNNLLVGYIK